MPCDQSAERARKLTTCCVAICRFLTWQACGNLQVTCDMYCSWVHFAAVLQEAAKETIGLTLPSGHRGLAAMEGPEVKLLVEEVSKWDGWKKMLQELGVRKMKRQ